MCREERRRTPPCRYFLTSFLHPGFVSRGYLPSVSTLDFASLFIVLTVWLWSVVPVVCVLLAAGADDEDVDFSPFGPLPICALGLSASPVPLQRSRTAPRPTIIEQYFNAPSSLRFGVACRSAGAGCACRWRR